MKRIVLGILILFQLQAAVWGQTINWNDTLEKIIQNSYDLKLSGIDINISDTKIKNARSEYFPKISAYSYNEYSKDLSGGNSQVTYIGNEVLFSDNIYQNSISLGLNYSLFDFGIKRDNLNIAKTDKKAKQAEYHKNLRDLELTAVEIYSKALSAGKQLEIKNDVLNLQKELAEAKKELNKAGKIDKTAAISEQIKIVQLEREITNIKNEYSKILEDLSYFSREKYNTEDLVVDDFESGKDISEDKLEAKIVKTEIFNLDLTPEFKIYDAEIAKKERELAIAKKQNLPMFNFSTNYYLYGADPSSFWNSYNDFGQRGLKFRLNTVLPIFDGLKNKSERERITLEIERLKIEKEQKLNDLLRNYRKIQNEADFAMEQLSNNKKMLGLVNTNLEMLERLNANRLIDRESYLNQKIELLNQKLETQLSGINKYTASFKLNVITKYSQEIEKSGNL